MTQRQLHIVIWALVAVATGLLVWDAFLVDLPGSDPDQIPPLIAPSR